MATYNYNDSKTQAVDVLDELALSTELAATLRKLEELSYKSANEDWEDSRLGRKVEATMSHLRMAIEAASGA